MKNQCIATLAILLSISVAAQQTRFYSDPEETFKEAKEYYQKEQYSLAYPLLKELQQSVHETDKINNATMVQEVNYYTIACALKQNEGRAEEMARNYIDLEKNNPRVQQLNFHLGEYYYRQEKFAEAAQLYEQSNIANLSNREIADVFCSALIILGLFTRLACIPLIFEMVFAFINVHHMNWAAGQGGGEPALLFATCFLTLLFTGAGRISIDRLIGK